MIRDEGLIEAAREKGTYLRTRTEEELGGSGLVTGFRGLGLILGIEISGEGGPARQVVDLARQAGVLLSSTGFEWDTIKVRPPLVISHAQLDTVARTIGNVVRALAPEAAAYGAHKAAIRTVHLSGSALASVSGPYGTDFPLSTTARASASPAPWGLQSGGPVGP